jgi:hypothetical protein
MKLRACIVVAVMVLLASTCWATTIIVPTDYRTIQEAVTAAGAGDTIEVAAGTYDHSILGSAGQASITKNVTVQGAAGGTTINITDIGLHWAVRLGANGAVLQNITFNKTDKNAPTGGLGRTLVLIQANDVTVQNCTLTGQFQIGENEVTRAIEVVGGSTGLLIQNNSISNLRQPGYFNPGATGDVLNNHVDGTRGWVVIGAVINFTDNTWGTNAVDVHLGDGTQFGAPYDPLSGMSARNNNANIQDGRTGPNPYRVTNVTQGTAYTTIQAAVNAANAGDTILCDAGTFNERVTVNKSLDLRGAQYGASPITVGARLNPDDESIVTEAGLGYANPSVVFEVPTGVTNVSIDGFTITGAASGTADTSAIRAWDDDITISNNIISGLYPVLHKGASNVTITDNRILPNKVGVTVQPNAADNVTVSGNIFSLGAAPAGGESAIYMTGVDQGSVADNVANGFVNGNGVGGSNLSNLTVSGNDFSGNRKGVDFWGNTHDVTISDNDVSNSAQEGINVKGTTIDITSNTADNCGTGIALSRNVIDTDNVTMSGNQMDGCTTAGVVLDNVTGASMTSGTIDNSPVGLLVTNCGAWTFDAGSTSFGADLTEFIRLNSAAGGALSTTDVDATSASFGGATTDEQIEAKVWHDVDEEGLGHVDWGQGAATGVTLAANDASGTQNNSVQLTAKLTSGGSALVGQTVSFSVDGGTALDGTTDAAGVASVVYPITEAAGTYPIFASFSGVSNYGAVSDTATLTVTGAPATGITIAPDPGSVASGDTITYTAQDNFGRDVTDQTTFYASAAADGSWVGNVYIAEKAGAWTVTGVYGGLSDTAPLSVTVGPAVSVAVTPAESTITTADTVTYTCEATDAAGNTWDATGTAAWAATSGGFTGSVYKPAAAGEVTVTATVDGQDGTATVTVNEAGGGGSILAWDRDTQKFYLCANPADPQTGTEVNGTLTVGDVTVTVTGRVGDQIATISGGTEPANSLRIRWSMSGGAVARAYQYSNIGGTLNQAIYSAGRTQINGAWKIGYHGAIHKIAGDPPTGIAFNTVEQ